MTNGPVVIRPTREHVALIQESLDGAVTLADLNSCHVWRSQTDVIKQAFGIACMCADLQGRFLLVDVHIGEEEKTAADRAPSVKGYFNKRFLDAKFTGRRIFGFDTVSTELQSHRKKHGKQYLHAHGIIEIPLGKSKKFILALLKKIFGKAIRITREGEVRDMGKRQIHAQPQNWTKKHSHNKATARGAVGKYLYWLQHMGTTHNDLGLNKEDKLQRQIPKTRGRINRGGERLAAAVPSNFTKAATIYDTASKQAAEEAFYLWLNHEKNQSLTIAPTIKRQKIRQKSKGKKAPLQTEKAA